MIQYDFFKQRLDKVIQTVIDKNIIIYGCNRGGDYIRWFLEYYYSKKIKAIMDRWELLPIKTVPHLWALYYIYDKDDIIINTTPFSIPDEFTDTGENWKEVLYTKNQIINLWDVLYGNNDLGDGKEFRQITFYDWLEAEYKLDIVKTIQRKYVGTGHGYFPTDFRMIYEGIRQCGINPEYDNVLDIGSGKGSAVIALLACGFRRVGAVEYTQGIYDVLIDNLKKLEISVFENLTVKSEGVSCYLMDASQMKTELDGYNWFFMFNPFSMNVLIKVIDNICESIRRKPRKCFIFYAEPIGHQYILNTGIFECYKQVVSDFSDVSYYAYIYRSKGDLNNEN